MTVKRFFDFDGGNVLTAGNDDVLGTILDLYVTIRMADREIAGVKITALERLCCCRRVFKVTLHHDIAAEHDFTDGFAIARHRLHGFRVDHDEFLQHRVTHALARL